MAEDFVNFENALRELKLSADQLKRLVSEGEIRAVRGENNTMRFRKEEIERLKQDTGKTIRYMEDSSDTLTDELLFDEADDLDVDDEGMATAQIGDDTLVGDSPSMVAPSSGGGRRGSRSGGRRGGKKGRGKQSPKPTPRPVTASAGGGGSSNVRRTTGRSTRMLQTSADMKASGIGMGVTAMLVLTFLVAGFCLFIWWDVSNDHLSGVTEGLAKWTQETFVSK